MKWVLLIIIIFCALLLLIVLTKLKVTIYVKHSQKDNDLKVKFSAWFGLLRYTIHVPLIKVDEDSPGVVIKHEEMSSVGNGKSTNKTKKFTASTILKSMQDTKTLVERVVHLHKIVKMFLKKVTITKLDWHTVFGIGDAAHTGIFIGTSWSIKGIVLGILSQYMKLKTKPNISVTPLFQQVYSETKLVCMIQFRVGHAMVAGIRLVKYWRGGIPNFKTSPLVMLSGGTSKKSMKS